MGAIATSEIFLFERFRTDVVAAVFSARTRMVAMFR